MGICEPGLKSYCCQVSFHEGEGAKLKTITITNNTQLMVPFPLQQEKSLGMQERFLHPSSPSHFHSVVYTLFPFLAQQSIFTS